MIIMNEPKPTPEMTSHKAIFASIAALLTTLVLSFFGFMPTSEEMLSVNVEELVKNIGALVTVAVVPGLTAYFKRNYRK